jgi:hypothetical protein
MACFWRFCVASARDLILNDLQDCQLFIALLDSRADQLTFFGEIFELVFVLENLLRGLQIGRSL